MFNFFRGKIFSLQFQYANNKTTQPNLLGLEALPCYGKSVQLLHKAVLLCQTYFCIPVVIVCYMLCCSQWLDKGGAGSGSSSLIQGRLSHTEINPLPTYMKNKPPSIHLSIQQLFSLPVSSAISEKDSILCFR